MFFHASIQWLAVLNVFILCGLLLTQKSKAGHSSTPMMFLLQQRSSAS